MQERRDKRITGAWRLLAGAGVLTLVAVAIWAALWHRSSTRSRLPLLGAVPGFSLVSSSGMPVTEADLRGGVWVADFIYTRCPNVCPRLTEQMARVQKTLGNTPPTAVRLVSFSVDPTNDTPETLRAYALRFHADPVRWLFLTGDNLAMYRLIHEGFLLPVVERPAGEPPDAEGPITHSNRFVLVDGELRVRGYYQGTDEESVQQLLRDIEALRGES